MQQNDTGAGTDPALNQSAQKIEYESGKGCLIFALIGIVLLGMTAVTIMLLGEPTTVAAMG